MTTLHLTNRLPSASNLTAPYIPPIASDVVIDLSHWQSSVDFVSAKSAGIAAVILKATQGSRWIDATFAMRFNAANAAGLLVGAYHFLDNSPPELQVENLLSVAGDCRVLALDAEPNGIGGTVTVAQAAEAAARLHMATGRAPPSISAATGPMGAERVFQTPSFHDARCGCQLTTPGLFVPSAGRGGRYGSTPMELSVPMSYLFRASAGVIAADSPALLLT
jgi:Glycosyl hydrolases family 25